jgi:putative oxidoreductase
MFHRLVETTNDGALTVLRVVMGVVFLIHGTQKVFGWFDGLGFSGTMRLFTDVFGIPAPLASTAILAEFFGSLALIAGCLGRIGALALTINMLGAIFIVHGRFGFFMNWTGRQPGEGIEYHILAIAMGVALVLRGSGALSLDGFLTQRLRQSGAVAQREQPAGGTSPRHPMTDPSLSEELP